MRWVGFRKNSAVLAATSWFVALGVSAIAMLSGCSLDLDAPPPKTGRLSGRLLVAPGTGLAGATVHLDGLELYSGAHRASIATTTSDERGFFEVETGPEAGLLLLRTTGGSYEDLVSGERIELDSSTGLRAVYRIAFFDKRDDLALTPVHSLVEAQFRFDVARLNDGPSALAHAYERIGVHFGGVDWRQIMPADVSMPATSPVDAVRAAFVLGGLSVLADDVRAASDSTPQSVHLFSLLDAATRDLAEGVFDGNDRNDATTGSGLQVGICPPVDPSCAAPPPNRCALGACRPLCDIYANLYRSNLVGAVRKFVGSRDFPSPWNRTGLGAEDARPLLEQIGANTDAELFGDACSEVADRVPPTLSWVNLEDGAHVRGTLTVQVRAIDDAEASPRASFLDHPDADSNPADSVATAVIDTLSLAGGPDGPFEITAVARDAAGNERRSTRALTADNTAPAVTLAETGFVVDGASIWWTGQSAPLLRGTITDLHPQHVQIVIGGEVVATAVPDGTTWSAQLPEGKLTTAGQEVTVRAVDRAGNSDSRTRTLRLDSTPPGVLVESSPVHDEGNSTVDYTLDNAGANTWLQRHVVGGTPVDLSQSTAGSCVTIRKFSHLLFENHVLGATGALNPLALNVIVSDDGVGLAPGTEQIRLVRRNGSTTTEVLPWRPVSGTPLGGGASRYRLGLYRDGAMAVPSLGTTEGEYHLEMRATDRLGRTTVQQRCWNHRLLAPKLKLTPGTETGSRAVTGARAMFATSLAPGAGQTGDFAEKFLNANPAGAAVWSWKVRNYLGVPIYVTVNIPRGVNANVRRRFIVRFAMANPRASELGCRPGGHFLGSPFTVYQTPENEPAVQHSDLRFRGRLFVMAGNDTGAEIGPCAGCTNDDESQSYTFEIPARSTAQGAPLAEYAVLTYLRPSLPVGGGTNTLLAPANSLHPDPGGVYSQFVLNGQTLTGRLVGSPLREECIEQQQLDEGGDWCCMTSANAQQYRALLSVNYEFLTPITTNYSMSAALGVAPSTELDGIDNNLQPWQTHESPPIP